MNNNMIDGYHPMEKEEELTPPNCGSSVQVKEEKEDKDFLTMLLGAEKFCDKAITFAQAAGKALKTFRECYQEFKQLFSDGVEVEKKEDGE